MIKEALIMLYEVHNRPLPVLVCKLNQGESIECQKGAMSWMTPTMQMQTGLGSGGKGLMGALGKMAKSAVTGESIFRNTYTATAGPGEIAFASTFPGDIISFDVGANQIIAQKRAYLASTPGVQMELAFTGGKKVGGIFGGEGLIMQKFTGNGTVFLEIDGCVYNYTLGAGESMLIDTGYLAAMEATCSMDVETVKGLGNIVAGGEGLFNTRVTGPGKIWLQTMPSNILADAIRPYIPTSN